VVPFALLGKRTRMVSVLTFCALLWGIAATCFAGVQNYSGAFACRFFIGLGGLFGRFLLPTDAADNIVRGWLFPTHPGLPVEVLRKREVGYSRRCLVGNGSARVSLVSFLQGRACLTTLSGFVNGIVAYGVSFIHVKLESWRILFMIEGGATVLIAIIAIIVLPDDIPSCKWFTAEEKDYRKKY
jgi:MFS family permease